MQKYDPFGNFLRSQSAEYLAMNFSEIERVLGSKLPQSAFDHQAWWANDTGKSHVQAKAWLQAGYETEQVSVESKKLVFRRIEPSHQNLPGTPGLSEPHRMFKADENIEKKSRRSPLFGALKGTFTIEPGWDLTKPALDPEELAAWEANLDRTADTIDEGLSGKRK